MTENHWETLSVAWWLRYRPDLHAGYWLPVRHGMQSCSSVLEVGCGIGKGCMHFLNQNYTGLDIASQAIDVARSLYIESPTRKFICGDARSFNYSGFDGIYIGNLIDHLQHYAPILDRVIHQAQELKFLAMTTVYPLSDSVSDKIVDRGAYFDNEYSKSKLVSFLDDRGFNVAVADFIRKPKEGSEDVSSLVLARRRW